MRKLFLTLAFLLFFSLPSLAQNSKYQNWCQQGGQTVTTSGLQSSTFVQRSFKTCTITVRTAAGNIATIYSNSAGTALANPFTNQNTTTGEFFFFAGNGFYNIQLAGTGLTTYTLGYVPLFDPTTATLTASGTLNYIPKVTSAGPPLTYGNSRIVDDGNYITVQLSGAPGLVDATSWSQSFLSRWSRLQNSTGNEFGVNIQTVTNTNTGAGTNYEKAALLVQAETADPSGATTRDQVGIDTRCIIWSSISTGRCWGLFAQGQIIAGGDGLAYGMEVDISNGGTDQPLGGTTTSKYGIHITSGQASGTLPATAAILIQEAFATFHKGFVASAGAFPSIITSNDSFIELAKTGVVSDLFRVKPTGQTLIGDLPNNGTLADYNSTVYGALTVREYLTVAGSTNTNKQILALFADTTTATHRIISSRYDASVAFLPITVEVSGSAINRWNLDLSMEFVANGSAATVSSAGTAKFRNNAGQMELSNNGGAYAALSGGGGGGSGIGGSGTTGYITVFSGTTTVGVTSGPLVEYNSSGNYALIYGSTSTLDPAQVGLESFKSSTTGSYILARNNSVGTTAYAGVAARIGAASSSTIDAILGVTSSGFTPAGPLSASQGFIRTGAQATAGFTIQTTAGTINFAPDGTAIVFKMTTDDAFEFTASSTAAVSSAGTAKLRNNAGQLEVSNNGAAFTAIPGAGGSGVGGSGTAGYIPIWTASTNTGNTTGPLFEVTAGGNCLVYGGVACDDSAQIGFNLIKASATGGLLVTRNATSGATAYAAVGARSGAAASTIDMVTGINSAAWTYSAPFSALQGFIKTGAQATAGMVIYAVAGSVAFAVNSTAIDYRMTSDHAFEFLNTSTAAVSGSGGVRMRNNAGSLEVSQNGAAYAAIGSGGGSIGGSGTTNLGAKFTAATTIGNSTYFDDGTTSTIGMNAASDDATTIRFQVEKDQNNNTYTLVRNATSGTLAAASMVARSGNAASTLDIAVGAISTATTTANGLVASSAYIRSGAGSTAGLYIQSAAGPIIFQPTGTTEKARFTTTGLGIGVTPATQLHVLATAETTRFAATGATVSSTFYVSTSTISGTIAGTASEFDFCFSNSCPSGVGATATTVNLFAGNTGILATASNNIVFTANGSIGGGVGPPSGSCSGMYAYIGTALACIEFDSPDSGGTGYRRLRVQNTF